MFKDVVSFLVLKFFNGSTKIKSRFHFDYGDPCLRTTGLMKFVQFFYLNNDDQKLINTVKILKTQRFF